MSSVARVAFLAASVGALACGSTVTFVGGDGDGGAGIPTTSSGIGAGGTSSGSGASGAGAAGAGGSSSSGTGASGAGGSTSSGGGAPPVCPPYFDECTQCASESCPEIWCGCYDNPECLDLFQCFGGCNDDPDCEQQCLAAHQGGISAVALVSGCAGTTCSGVCEWGNGEFTPCQECIYQDCADAMNACVALPACVSLWSCFDACAPYDLSCQQQCYLDYPDGVSTLETTLQCIVDLCEQPCN